MSKDEAFSRLEKMMKLLNFILAKSDPEWDPYKQYKPSAYVLCLPCAETTHQGVCMTQDRPGLWPMKAFEGTTCHWCHEPQDKGTLIIPFGDYPPVMAEGEGRETGTA
jgi:hypothetical protein